MDGSPFSPPPLPPKEKEQEWLVVKPGTIKRHVPQVSGRVGLRNDTGDDIALAAADVAKIQYLLLKDREILAETRLDRRLDRARTKTLLKKSMAAQAALN